MVSNFYSAISTTGHRLSGDACDIRNNKGSSRVQNVLTLVSESQGAFINNQFVIKQCIISRISEGEPCFKGRVWEGEGVLRKIVVPQQKNWCPATTSEILGTGLLGFAKCGHTCTCSKAYMTYSSRGTKGNFYFVIKLKLVCRPILCN